MTLEEENDEQPVIIEEDIPEELPIDGTAEIIARLESRIIELEARVAACESTEWASADHTHEGPPAVNPERAPTSTHIWSRPIGRNR